MIRASHLEASGYSLYAHGRPLKPGTALALLASWSKAKGFSHPELDVAGGILPLVVPVEPIGFFDKNCALSLSKIEEKKDSIYPNIIDSLMPCRPIVEKWPWSRMRDTLRSNARWSHFRPVTRIQKTINAKISNTKAQYRINCQFCSPYAAGGLQLWSVFFSVSANGRGNVRPEPEDDPFLMDQISQIAISWAALIGCPKSLEFKPAQVDSPPLWHVEFSKTSNYKGPYIGLDTWVGTDHGASPAYVLPGGYTGALPATSRLSLTRSDLETAIQAYETAFRPFFGIDPEHTEIKFGLSDQELPEFKTLAKPVFGSPWLQEISGYAQPDYLPRTDAGIPDWSIQPVAHFKILGSWRAIYLLKDPDGWRFLITGKYTKDPLKHRHIRDELARKAGMTSETLWEPQEAGEGWLGVPG